MTTEDMPLPPAPRPYFLITNLQVAMLQHIERELRPYGATPTGARVLSAILRRPMITSSRLARMFGISPQSMKQTIISLLKAGHVTREVSPADRRTLNVACTESGRIVAEAHYRAVTSMYKVVFGDMTELEMTMLVGLLEKALKHSRPESFEYYIDTRAVDRNAIKTSYIKNI